ncbi:MAG: S1 family peptidase [Actinomycetes bacterium]
MRRVLACVAIAVTSLTALPAAAIIGGAEDGDQHPGVGLIYFRRTDGLYRCSGTLVEPTVVVTAAHCTEGSTDVHVTFDASAPRSPLATTNPGDPSRFIDGTAHADPAYTGGFKLDTLDDIGVVVLDRPASDVWPNITLTPLATAGAADGLRPGNGRAGQTIFTAVGYGIRFEHPTDGPAKPAAVSDRVRRNATVPLQMVRGETIKTADNANDSRGTGGTCFGDSGGALLLDGRLIGVTSWGASQFCIGVSGFQRTESAHARAFLSQYLTLP